jgi:DnaJ family protein C protein 3
MELISSSGNQNFLFTYLVFFFIELLIKGAESTSEVDRHLEMGRDFLARGQLGDALSHYHAAVEGDNRNYLTYFKRATVYLALGKAKLAISDLDRAIELNRAFTTARQQRGSVYLKMGDYDNAERDLYTVLQEDPYNEEALYMYERINPARQQIDLVHDVLSRNDHQTAVALLSQLLEVSPWSPELRELRAQSNLAIGDRLSAVSDFRSVNRLMQDGSDDLTTHIFKLAKLLYELGHAADSLKEVRECLKLDPEHKLCFPFYKKIKKIDKFMNDAETHKEAKSYEECILSAEKVLKNEKEVPMIIFGANQYLCSCYGKSDKYTDAITHCNAALKIEKDPSILCDLAEALLGEEMYDDAVRSYQDALELDENLQRAKEGIERAKRLQKQAEKRDYYKILGVTRSATTKEITKAYRKMAQKWHPDNFAMNESERKIAEKKFIDIAAAKEVLTDPEKRAQFDNGEDPLDPEGRSNGFRNGNPFQHFNQFQQGSPFQFKFHFS